MRKITIAAEPKEIEHDGTEGSLTEDDPLRLKDGEDVGSATVHF